MGFNESAVRIAGAHAERSTADVRMALEIKGAT
jgi:hypothetical protein